MRDFLVKIALKFGLYKQIVEYINRVKFEIQARRMRKNGLDMLDAANRVFATMNVRAFLTYGALLGAYRDKGFISYDPDIDLGVLSSEIPDDLPYGESREAAQRKQDAHRQNQHNGWLCQSAAFLPCIQGDLWRITQRLQTNALHFIR